MHHPRGSLKAIGVVLLAVSIGSCSPSEPSLPGPSFARFRFFASGIEGMLEVDADMPAICYSTQSSPARPITVLSRDLVDLRSVASYTPSQGTYCDRSVTQDTARDIVENPHRYFISWQPALGGRVVLTPLVGAEPWTIRNHDQAST